tara:strand:+ start:170 stop:484 length:315 start_codon:yes stop_codon:yes gene_type:complete
MARWNFKDLMSQKSLITLVSFFLGFYLFSPGVLITLPPVPGDEVGTAKIADLFNGNANKPFAVTNEACLVHAALFAVCVVVVCMLVKAAPTVDSRAGDMPDFLN